MRRLFLFALLATACWTPTGSASLPSTALLHGQVVDEDGLPLAGAQIEIAGTNVGTVSDSDGRFVLSRGPAGEQLLRVSAMCHLPDSAVVEVPEPKPMQFQLAWFVPTVPGAEACCGRSRAEQRESDPKVCL